MPCHKMPAALLKYIMPFMIRDPEATLHYGALHFDDTENQMRTNQRFSWCMKMVNSIFCSPELHYLQRNGYFWNPVRSMAIC